MIEELSEASLERVLALLPTTRGALSIRPTKLLLITPFGVDPVWFREHAEEVVEAVMAGLACSWRPDGWGASLYMAVER